jgi:hypothetical protein
MTIEDWEVVNATLLWINLKAGILPLNGKVLGACEKTPNGRDNDLAQKTGDQTRLGAVKISSQRTTQRSRRSCEKSESAHPHTLRLLRTLRLVWSRHEQSNSRDVNAMSSKNGGLTKWI